MNEDVRPTDAELTRSIKAALHKAFPQTKFAVTRGGSWVKWTDDGPQVAAVEDIIIATGLAEVDTDWKGNRRLSVGAHSVAFNRYNADERAASQADEERRRAEQQARRQRTDAALTEIKQQKWKAIAASERSTTELDTRDLQAVTQAFETSLERAEAAVAIEGERQRRPSWAPPLALEGELLELCRSLEYLSPDGPPIARLWANYADPKHSGRVLRESISSSPLAGIECRGFELFAGSERGNVSQLLFEAQCTQKGAWRFGPQLYMSRYYSPRAYEWERLTRERLEAEDRLACDKALS